MTHPTSDSRRDDLEAAAEAFDKRRDREAFERYRRLAEGGSTGAQLRLGWMYHAGRGVEKDVEAARRWYRIAADANSPEAQLFLGNQYWRERRYQDAIEAFEKAAAQNYGPALYQLGVMHFIGAGVVADKAQAYRYFDRAARLGHLFAQREIAVRMIKGHHGIIGIVRGAYTFVRLLCAMFLLGLKDPYSDRIRT